MKRKVPAIVIGVPIASASVPSSALVDLEDLIPRLELSSTERPAMPDNLVTQLDPMSGVGIKGCEL